MSAALSGAAVARREVARKRVVIAFMILSWADINGGGSVDLSTRVSSEKFRRFPLYLAGGGDAGVLGTGGREENGPLNSLISLIGRVILGGVGWFSGSYDKCGGGGEGW